MKHKTVIIFTVAAAFAVGAFIAPFARAVTVYTNPSASGSAFCGGGSTENLGFISALPGNAVTVFTFGSVGSQYGGGAASFAIFSDPSYSNLVQTGSLGAFNFGYPSGGVANYAVFVSGFLPSGYWQVSIGAFCSPAVSTAGYNGLTINQELPPPGPTSLVQRAADGTTPIAQGGVTTGATVVFGASIHASTSTDPLQFQVEVQPSANGFSGNPTAVASSSQGQSVTATVSGLQDGSYHWTARVYDPVTHAATPWQLFSSSTTDFVVADVLVPTSSTVLTDSTTVYSAGNGFVGGCCPNTVMSPGPVFYQAPTPFAIQSIVVDDTDFSSNNHDGVGNIRASIYDLHGNLIARSLNTLYGESGCTGCAFVFSSEAVPQSFQLSLVVEDGIQGDGGFTVRNLRFVVAPQSCIPDKVVSIDIADSCGILQWLQSSKWSQKFDDGTALEVSCSLALNNSGFPAYMAWFTDSNGNRSRIAQCLFRDGVNDATYTVGHLSGNQAQSCLASVDWHNVDGGANDGPRQATDFLGNPIIFTTNIEPYIDVVDYQFDANDKKLSWKDEKFQYPDATQFADELTVGNILNGFVQPVAGLTFAVDPLIGPELDNAFNTAWLEMQSDPGGPMRFIPGCDLNGDGVCDSTDQAMLTAALGKCAGQSGYIPRIDYDRDGCIDVNDAAVVQASFSAYRAGCVQSQGYWKTHPANWPITSLSIGGNLYSEDELLVILKSSVSGNGAINLAHQLIGAKLNIAAGASSVAAPVASADALLNLAPSRIPPFGNAFLPPTSVSGYVDTLSRYNEGFIGPAACRQ